MHLFNYRKISRKQMRNCCERCSSQRFLEVHHKDRDLTNNHISNLETLCRSCHAKEHERWRNLKKKRTAMQLDLFENLCFDI